METVRGWKHIWVKENLSCMDLFLYKNWS